ncbi:hypothetical protein DXG01_003970 [Tephrocybe rancida]|nr:hypothetical protein DXG01_003970 [Tephrocybe rancida]
MPARPSKNARSPKNKPVATPPVEPEPQLVDFAEGGEREREELREGVGPPIEDRVGLALSIPYLEEEELEPEKETEPDAPPIPIPVPRSQTPQLVSGEHEYVLHPQSPHHTTFDLTSPTTFNHTPAPPVQRKAPRPSVSHVHTSPAAFVPPPSVPQEEHEERDPFSYAYGFSPTSPTSYTGLPSPSPPARSSSSASPGSFSPSRNVSGLARTIRAAVSPSRQGGTGSGVGKRFAPAAKAAVPVVDLGTAAPGKGGVEHRVPAAPVRRKSKEEEVLWARWDELGRTRLLLVGYPSTLRIWDTADLGSVAEVVRVPLSSFDVEGEIVGAAVLPGKDREGRIGIAFSTGTFIVYSLTTHRVFTRFQVGHASLPAPARGGGTWKAAGGASIDAFEASKEVVVVSTTSPPGLHVFSSTSYELLLEIPGARLALYAPPPPIAQQAPGGVGVGVGTAKAMLSSAVRGALGSLQQANAAYGYPAPPRDSRTRDTARDTRKNTDDTMYDTHAPTNSIQTTTTTTSNDNLNTNNNDIYNTVLLAPPRPIYALSHRLLAYASIPSSSPTSIAPRNSPHLQHQHHQLQTAAQTAAQSVWGGMRTLGGLAVSAARSRMGSVDLNMSPAGGVGAGPGVGVGRFFSRSAPERRGRVDGGTGGEREREREVSVSPGDGGGVNAVAGATVVTVLDLAPLLRGGGAGRKPETVLEIAVERDRPLSRLSFTADGCSLGAVPRDGTGVRVYSIRPQPHSSLPASEKKEGSAWATYHLRRGRTSAVVENLEWSKDGRWVAMGTRKGTIHLFGTNPYGGKLDVRSHWEGRVRNVDGPQPMPTEMGPLVRIRSGVTPAQSPNGAGQVKPRPALAFKFIEPSDTGVPAHLLPSHTSSPALNALSTSHPRSYSSQHAHTDPSVSPPQSPSHARPSNYQDVLLFDPGDGMLALRRVVLEMRPRDQGVGMGMGLLDGTIRAGVNMTSISLPGMGFAGALSSSPSSGGGGAQGQPGRGVGEKEREGQMELAARESTVMTWNLGGWQGGEVRKILGGEEGKREVKGRRADWLAQAELSTCSKSSRVLPRPIYLSHQFSFHTLGEDYHALIRRYQLDIGGLKIDVRREVQVSAYTSTSGGGGESFVEGFASPRDIRSHHRTLSSSFDEPLASALANELEHPSTSGVLPMLPNGTPGSYNRRNAIPIRSLGLGDGVTEGLGRLRREIGKVRSPKLRPRPDSVMSASVPLEFDEEDEDFVGPNLTNIGVDVEGEGGELLGVPRPRPASSSRETSRGDGDEGSGPTVSTPATSEDDWDRGAGMGVGSEKSEVQDTWGGWSTQDKLAVEEVERFDNIDVLGLLDEEQAPVVPVRPQGEGKRKGRTKRRG